MKLSLKSALLISATAFGVAAVGISSGSQAYADSNGKLVSNQALTSKPDTRTVTFTGSDALYTKAPTVSDAKVVASKTTLSTLKDSGSSRDNVQAYRVAKAADGKVYYKVVTFDGQYRGWIYGGTNADSFNGGIKKFDTFKDGTVTNEQKNNTYVIANPGTADDGKTVTYKAPAWTQYKVGRMITDSTPYKGTTFKIDQVGTRTREGDQWVHIVATDLTKGAANGWIMASGLKETSGVTNVQPIADNAVRINVTDKNGNAITSIDYTKANAKKGAALGVQNGVVWTLSTDDQTAIQKQLASAISKAGYSFSTLSALQISEIARGEFGSSVTLTLPVDSTSNQEKSTIIPYGAVKNASAQKLTSTTSQIVNASYTFNDIGGGDFGGLEPKKGTLTAQKIYEMQQSGSTDYKNLLYALSGKFLGLFINDNIQYVNKAFQNAAETQYTANNNLSFSNGEKGSTFAADQVMSYLNNSSAKTLQSPLYPQFEMDSTGSSYTVNWYHIKYTVQSADGGTNGQPVIAYYAINPKQK